MHEEYLTTDGLPLLSLLCMNDFMVTFKWTNPIAYNLFAHSSVRCFGYIKSANFSIIIAAVE